MAGSPPRFPQPIQMGDAEGASAVKCDGTQESASQGNAMCAHVVLGLSDGTTRGGHLIEGRVFPTLEVVVTENPAET